MNHSVSHKRVAILVADGFEQVEFTKPKQALEEAGAEAVVVSLKKQAIRGFNHHEPGDSFDVDMSVDEAAAADFDALMLPGGVMNPDLLRGNPKAVEFARSFFESHKPVFAICHGPQLLIEADVVEGRTLTSWPSVRSDLENAGAIWKDAPVVVDKGLVTSRKPDDIPDFNEKMLEELAEGKHPGQRAGGWTNRQVGQHPSQFGG